MGYLPGFDNDVFISYTHKDNYGPGAQPDTGWVTRFHLDLQQRLSELLGVDARIWRDKKLRGSDDFSAEIFAQLKGSAVFIPILSPGYLRSSWCQNELEEFQKAALQSGGFEIGKVVRAVKVVKPPLAQGQHRNILSRCLGYEFFVQQPDSIYFDALGSDGKDYEQGLSRLAQDIAHILRTIESAPPAKTSRATVYLAESSSDLKVERQRVLDELLAQGYRALPEAPLPEHVSDIRHVVEAALQQSALAIHLTGPRYGKRPEGTDESIVALQYELARRGGLRRVVWVATKPEDTEAPQAAFLEALRTGLDQHVDLLEHKTIEDLKDVILARLAPRAPEAVPLVEGDDLCRIYLICDQEDNPLDSPTRPALALRDFLFDAGFEVKLPVAGKTAAKSRQKDNRRKLEECDAVVLSWGLARQTWVEEQLSELKKALGWRRARPFSAKAIYVTAPEADEKRIYRTREARVIAQFGHFAPEPIAPFLEDLRRPRG
ncbi:MAG: toll/interleukin-1 receptor domain-containing protein [Gammaproteobacteria bacterium]